MKKIVILSIFLFWFCLMFPDNSYIKENSNKSNNLRSGYSFTFKDKEFRCKFLDLFYK